MKSVLLFLFFLISSQAASGGPLRCSQAHLLLKTREALGLFTAEDQHRLGIGVYAETKTGDFMMGISPYSGALHQELVVRMNDQAPLQKILWMGELRYDSTGPHPQIISANETSGYFHELKAAVDSHKPMAIQIENDVRNLPEILLNKYFSGRRFENSGETRLARELRNVDGNIRHGIGNSLQIMQSLLQALHRENFSIEQKIQILTDVASRQTGDVGLVRWVIHDLLNERRIRIQDIDVALEFVDLVFEPNFSQANVQAILSKDKRVIAAQLQNLNRFNQGDGTLVPVDFWIIRNE